MLGYSWFIRRGSNTSQLSCSLFGPYIAILIVLFEPLTRNHLSEYQRHGVKRWVPELVPSIDKNSASILSPDAQTGHAAKLVAG